MDDKEAAFFGLLIIGILCLFAGIVGMHYWDAQQVRVMYQQVYAKNMECRVSITQSRGSDFVNKVCGEIPNFKGYND